MVKIASLDLRRINYIQILELLREALHLLSQVREQWNNLVLFFSEIAARAEVALSGTLQPFIDQSVQAAKKDLTKDDRLFYVSLLKTQAIEVHKQSFSLFLMSRTYVDMSSQFMMKRLAGLSKMLTASNDHERNRMRQKLNSDTEEIQEKVADLVAERKATYTKAIKKRRRDLIAFVNSLGGAKEEDSKVIEEAKGIAGLY
mgnify:CR=1 FL=1